MVENKIAAQSGISECTTIGSDSSATALATRRVTKKR